MADSTPLWRVAAPLRKYVADDLREAIQGGDFAPGERLVEQPLCERFDVSRTVVREALRLLEAEGLVTMVPNRGPIVTVLTTEDIRSLYAVRQSLEGLAGAEFAERAEAAARARLLDIAAALEAVVGEASMRQLQLTKDEFYAVLLSGAKNPILAAMLEGIHGRTRLARRYSMQTPGRPIAMASEIRAIAEAAARGDVEAARLACEAHIRIAGELAIAELDRLGQEVTSPGLSDNEEP